MPRSVRDIAVVLFLLGISLVILFYSGERSGESLVGHVVYAVISPFQRAGHAVHSRVKTMWESYVALIAVRDENRLLKENIATLRRERSSLLGEERENRRLRKLLNLKARYEFPCLAAQVIGEDAVGWFRTFFINRGSEDGVSVGMAVTVAEGLVGRVSSTGGSVSSVLLITDPGLSVDCRVARTRDRGVLSGHMDGECVLRYLELNSQVRPDDEIVTSGLDGMFPRGLVVGRVKLVRKGSQGLFMEAQVVPTVRFREVEEVLVILGNPTGFDIRTGLEESL